MIKPITYTGKDWEARKSLISKMPPLPERPYRYSLLYPDPPWKYRDKANAGKRGTGHKYPTLSLPEIKCLRPEIDRVAAPDCALALWATAPMMDEAREVMDAWGFAYSTIAVVWIKTYPLEERLRRAAQKLGVTFEALVSVMAEEEITMLKARKGMGNWTRSNAEFLLYGTRGKVERVDAGVSSVVVAETREHSRKPDEVRDLLVRLLGDVPRLEMFARTSAPGWDSWGLEVGVFDDEEEEDEP